MLIYTREHSNDVRGRVDIKPPPAAAEGRLLSPTGLTLAIEFVKQLIDILRTFVQRAQIL